ncbi:Predicted RNA methylase involved in rRNA processing [Phaffia rhodozyma]|uniref:Ribosomal RNA-processing protein 8 n=1 Tax=Phaffia rhodozyma TaxID=264483 RepID=A0A0F7SPM7_PHARH|nr:Predicted RNA methylase involved in rRNA processing [Phaffia rhodozyma]
MSFETPGWGKFPSNANSSLPANNNPSGNKRKRPSAAAAAAVAGGEASFEMATVNLDKLMANLEKEERANKNAGNKAKVEPKKAGKAGESKPAAPGAASKKNQNKNKNQNQNQKKNQKAGQDATSAQSPSKNQKAIPPSTSARAPASAPAPNPASAPTSAAAPSADSTSEPPLKKSKKGKKPKTVDPALASILVAVAPSAESVQADPSVNQPAPSTATVDDLNTVVIPLEDEGLLSGDKFHGLTPMQAKMKKKLAGARFRWINEQLYTTSSASALEMMKSDPEIFSDYHQGFRSQTQTWPQSPVSVITSSLRSTLAPGSLIIDLGCGDAELAKSLVPSGFKVLSYDLVPDEWVIRGDFCETIDLPGGEGPEGRSKGAEVVDAAVCSLSLMGRNWVNGIRQIARVLKDGGRLEIAEVKSRMSSVEAFVKMVSSFGFDLTRTDETNTHFISLSFTRSGLPTWSNEGSLTWDDVLREGETVLKACVYKKR